MTFNTRFLVHVSAVQTCLESFGAKSSLDLATFILRVEARNRYFELRPQFVYYDPEPHFSTALPAAGVVGFIGWKPYFNRRWTEAYDKLAFKRFCTCHNLPTPAYGTTTFPPDIPYLIKKQKSSFGSGIRGPFRSEQAARGFVPLKDGEYREAFTDGTSAKAWYWNDKLVCLELCESARISGNGTDTLATLASARAGDRSAAIRWPQVDDLLAYQGLSKDMILAPDISVMVEFRFGAPLSGMSQTINHNLLNPPSQVPAQTVQQLSAVGPAFWQLIPAEIRQGTLYSVDAVIQGEGQVAYLEMNCNPVLHPDIYPHLFEELFGPADNAATRPARAEGAPASPVSPVASAQSTPQPSPAMFAEAVA